MTCLFASCRRIDNRLNVFRNIHRNWWFISIFIATAIIQALVVQFGSFAFQTVPLDGAAWGISIGIGLLSLPIGVLVRLIPNTLFPKTWYMPKRVDTVSIIEQVPVVAPISPEEQWRQAEGEVKGQLTLIRAIRGGRIHQIRRWKNLTPPASHIAAAVVMPSLMASSLGIAGETRPQWKLIRVESSWSEKAEEKSKKLQQETRIRHDTLNLLIPSASRSIVELHQVQSP